MTLHGSQGELRCSIPDLPLLSGEYSFNFWIVVDETMKGHYAGFIPPAVAEGDYYHTGKTTVRKCTFYTPRSWSHSNEVNG